MTYPTEDGPQTKMEAVIFGLYLALTASTDEKSTLCSLETEKLAVDMTKAEIAYAKEQAEAMYAEDNSND